MALRCFYFVLALSMLIGSGCHHSRSNYQPACGPAVVAATPVPAAPCAPGQVPAAPCAPGQVPAPPPPGVLVPR